MQNELRDYKKGYEALLNLPDEIFDSAQELPSKLGQDDAKTNETGGKVEQMNSDSNGALQRYNRDAVERILAEARRPLKKVELAEKFESLYPQYKGTRAVTYAISGLQKTNRIKPYKPLGINIKGNYWTLTSWWDGDKLKEQYRNKIS